MQQWLPDPLVEDVPAVDFEAELEAGPDSTGLFRLDYADTAGEGMLSLLSKQEREQIYQLVEADIEVEYRDNFEAAEKERSEGLRTAIEEIIATVKQERAEILSEVARETVHIATAIAGRIVRKSIEVDQDVLIRALESMLFRVADSGSMEVTVNPAEAKYLREQEELIAKLGITAIVEDRRVEAGGCLMCCDRREWDATIASQLEVLSEVTAETIVLARNYGDDDGSDNAPVE